MNAGKKKKQTTEELALQSAIWGTDEEFQDYTARVKRKRSMTLKSPSLQPNNGRKNK